MSSELIDLMTKIRANRKLAGQYKRERIQSLLENLHREDKVASVEVTENDIELVHDESVVEDMNIEPMADEEVKPDVCVPCIEKKQRKKRGV